MMAIDTEPLAGQPLWDGVSQFIRYLSDRQGASSETSVSMDPNTQWQEAASSTSSTFHDRPDTFLKTRLSHADTNEHRFG